MITENLTNENYHARAEVSSSVLKAALLSKAHLKQYLEGKKKSTDAMILGTAIHCYYLERERFDSEYRTETELYLRKTGEHNVGDPKLDEDGEPLQSLVYINGDVIKGENYKKFKAMAEAIDNCERAKEMLKGGRTEVSIISGRERVRPDLITEDGWIVDLKTVGGLSELPSEETEFAKTFWNLSYDLSMYMYYKVCKAEGLDVKGFIFMTVDAKIPSGIRFFVFTPEDEWFKYGEMRYNKAWKKYEEYMANPKDAPKYDTEVVESLPLPFKAIGALNE